MLNRIACAGKRRTGFVRGPTIISRCGGVHFRRMLVETLECRRLLATWTFRIDRAGDDVTLGFNGERSRYEIRDTASGDLLASRNAGGSLTAIKVVGGAAPDTLRIAESLLEAPLPVRFEAGNGVLVSDTIGAEADADMTLTTELLTITPLDPDLSPAALTLVGVENAELIGGDGDNTFDVTGFAPEGGGSVTLMGGGGSDTYIEGCGDLNVAITDSVDGETNDGGNDEYFLCGSTVVVTDDGGDDVYVETDEASPPASNFVIASTVEATTATTNGSHITLNDQGDGNDQYFLHGSTVVVIDDGGDDIYIETETESPTPEALGLASISASATSADSGSYLELHDRGDGDDQYFFHGSTVVVIDDGGDDIYVETDSESPPPESLRIASFSSASAAASSSSYIELHDLGEGHDTIDFSGQPGGVTLTMNDAGGTGTSSSAFVFEGSFEVVILTPFDDNYTRLPTSAGTTIRALGGDDIIDLSASTDDDTIDGGLGNDVMLGGTGNTTFVETPGSADVIIDSGGVDTIDFSGATLGVKFNLNLNTGQGQVVDSAGNTVAVTGTLEIVIGSNFDDDLAGNSFDNVLIGLAGDDRLSGHTGRDVLIGGTGADRIVGGTGQDLLIGGRTVYDRNDVALRMILAEWSQSTDSTDGFLRLKDVLFKGTSDPTVLDDDQVDQLTGSNGPDWLLFNDVLTDLLADDEVTDLDPREDIINDGPPP